MIKGLLLRYIGVIMALVIIFIAGIAECAIVPKILRVHGNSMSPLIEDGVNLEFLEGYYESNPVERGDIVVHQYAPGETPLVKSVKAVRGDTLALMPGENNTWHIMVNNKALKNSQGVLYTIGVKAYSILSLYVNDYKGVIPDGAVLLMGDNPQGSFDATELGLTAVTDLLGKAVWEK